ncbi:hypothetical protein V5799_027302, partial [Amblyomma americanum]
GSSGASSTRGLFPGGKLVNFCNEVYILLVVRFFGLDRSLRIRYSFLGPDTKTFLSSLVPSKMSTWKKLRIHVYMRTNAPEPWGIQVSLRMVSSARNTTTVTLICYHAKKRQ